MKTMRMQRIGFGFVILLALATSTRGQITSNAGDGVLNAPYRGTITSLREASQSIAYGEVRAHCEPFTGNTDLFLSGSTMTIEALDPWDRSVIRLFEGIDASGPEVNLSTGPKMISISGDSFKRFSVKAIGTKTLTPLSFRVRFSYQTVSGFLTPTRTWVVAPFTGSFSALPGESEAFHFGTPILSVSVGDATLIIPTGRTAEMIGATFEEKDTPLGPSGGGGSTKRPRTNNLNDSLMRCDCVVPFSVELCVS